MKRLITYLYNYESGTKGKGTGFIRVDQRGREIRMDVHVENAKQMQGKAKLYLIAGKSPVRGIYVGDIVMIRGEGNGSFRFSALHICDSEMDFSDVFGVAIRNSEGYLASNWQEESCPELLKGTFKTVGQEMREEIPPDKSENVDMQLEIKEEEVPSGETPYERTNTEKISIQEAPPMTITPLVFEKPIYRKIQLSQIRSLPPQHRHFGNNNFLRHGFFNYNYLILKKEITAEGEQWSLGVPGVYEHPEKAMANLFGFSRFEPQEEGEDENLKEGTPGAWFTQLVM